MSTSEFNHGFSAEFLPALESLAHANSLQGQWWRDLLVDPDLILAVRRDKLDFYYRGQSIFQVFWKAPDIVADTHFKYLVRQKQFRADLDNQNRFKFKPEELIWLAYEGRSTLREIINTAKGYAGPEKTGLHALIKKANPQTPVIDVEAAFTNKMPNLAENAETSDQEDVEDLGVLVDSDEEEKADTLPTEQESKIKQDRIDVVTLEKRGESVGIVFHEAKYFANSELRGHVPPVVRKLMRYQKTIENHKSYIESSYRAVSKILLRLDELRKKIGAQNLLPAETRDLMYSVAEGIHLQVDIEPRLIVFGYDKDQKDGALQRLFDKFRHSKEISQLLEGSKLSVYPIGNPNTGGRAAFSFNESNQIGFTGIH